MTTHMLAHKVLTYMNSQALLPTDNNRILVGVSGGADSMALLHALHMAGYQVAVAHCNFSLRASESDQDEAFVTDYAQTLHIPLHTIQFDTKAYAKTHGVSIEMAARELRYNWFETLCSEQGYTHIAIAHNENDTIETFFINLLRGAGIKGLTGIPHSNGKIIRPLLTCNRTEIEAYAKEHGIAYRIDSSNLESEYQRNKVRNQVLPLLEQIQPQASESVRKSMQHLHQTLGVYTHAIEQAKEQVLSTTQSGYAIDETAIATHPFGNALLFEILYSLGFVPDVIQQVYEGMQGQSGKTYYSPTHSAYHDRQTLYIEQRTEVVNDTIILHGIPMQPTPFAGGSITWQVADAQEFVVPKHAHIAAIDMQAVAFPITIRPWKPGDSFTPFGMKGSKKISDYLIDKKVPLHKKQRIHVLESNNKILWVIGMQIHHAAAVKPGTKKILLLQLQNL